MKKRMLLCLALTAALCLTLLTGCAKSTAAKSSAAAASASAGSASQSSAVKSAETSAAKSSDSSASSASSAPAQSSSSAASSETAYSAQELTDALDACCSYETGTAGSSLQAVKAASGLVSFSAKNMTDANRKAIGDDIQKWYDALSTDKKASLKANWDEIYQDAQKLVADPSSMKDALSDAGVDTDFTSMDLTTGISAANCVNSLVTA